MPPNVGDRLGHYEVTPLIDEGGMGQVYQATDTQLHRDVRPARGPTFASASRAFRSLGARARTTYRIPDEEAFTAPVRDSMNGTIRFNTPTLYHGTTFSDIELGFEDGRIVSANANDSD